MSLARLHTSGRPNAVWILAIRSIKIVVAASVALLPFAHAEDGNVEFLVEGTWGLSMDRDPFKKRFPATTYVAPGTILFGSQDGRMDNYLTARLHYGHQVQIAESSKRRSLDGLIDPLPSNTIILHSSILCLKQTNRIVKPPGECARKKPVAGRGWVYRFQSVREGWVNISTVLGRETMEDLDVSEADTNFDVSMDDLKSLEKQGYLTLLNRTHPASRFYYDDNERFIKCGTTEIKEDISSIGAGADIRATAKIGFLKFVLGGFGASVEGSVASKSEKKEITIELDTSKQSHHFYAAHMVTEGSEAPRMIRIEKTFSCKSGTSLPGDRIERVRFEITNEPGTDPTIYPFEKASDFLPVPDGMYKYHSRPIFISANSPRQFERALGNIVAEHRVDVHLAHFMLSNINYSCSQEQRDDCACLIDGTCQRGE